MARGSVTLTRRDLGAWGASLGAGALASATWPSMAAAAVRPDRRTAFRYRYPTPGSGIDTGGAVIDVHAPLARVLAEVQRFDRYHAVLPKLEQSRIVNVHRGVTDVYLRAPILRGVAHIWGVARFSKPKRWRNGLKIVGRLVKGNLDGWFGVWKMRRCGPATVLRLEMFIDVMVPVPDSWVTPEIEWAADMGVTAIRDIIECGEPSVR